MPRPNIAAASTGKTTIARIEVISTVQVNSGIRNIVIPGARMHTIVVMKLTEPRMVPKPPRPRPKTHRLPPRPGLNVELDSGA